MGAIAPVKSLFTIVVVLREFYERLCVYGCSKMRAAAPARLLLTIVAVLV
jgi:hypothetical protein